MVPVVRVDEDADHDRVADGADHDGADEGADARSVLPPVSKRLQIRGIPPKKAARLELLLWRRAQVTVFQEH
jgi:hypothetical protein